MRPYSLLEIAGITGGEILRGDRSLAFTRVGTDSRKIGQGDLFGALVGERSDGHDFVVEVVRKGAGGAVVEHPVPGLKEALASGEAAGRFGVIKVASTVRALQALASAYRRELPVTVVGVTGSVGKTSTKDMVASVLRAAFATYRNPGNLNSHIGLPLAVLAMDGSPEYAVLEMAMRARGEIAALCAIARPRIGILTDISLSHVGVLGSIEEIALAKAELLESLPEDGVAIVSGDNDWVRKMSRKARCRVVFYGLSEGAGVRAVDIEPSAAEGSRFKALVAGRAYEFRLKIPGVHQVHNALAAVAVGFEAGIPYEKVRDGLADASMSPMRLEVTQGDRITIINDAYNASPKSMRAALDLLAVTGRGRKVAVLGDMLEMGDYGPEAHREVGAYARTRAGRLVCAGDLAREIKAGWDQAGEVKAPAGAETPASWDSSWFSDKAKMQAFLASFLRSGDVCLVKASRGMGFESIVSSLKEMRFPGGS